VHFMCLYLGVFFFLSVFILGFNDHSVKFLGDFCVYSYQFLYLVVILSSYFESLEMNWRHKHEG
jgi:hypothetical protein